MLHFTKAAFVLSVSFICAACETTPTNANTVADAVVLPATPMQPGGAEPYTALGTEPFWSLQITDTQMTFQPMEGEPVVASIASARPSFNGWRYSSDKVSVDVTFTSCNDGMSDTVYKDTVTVLVGTTEFRGCGGETVMPGANLAHTQWQIISVNGRDIYNPMGRGPLLVRFGRTGLSAATGCNGLSGTYLSGEGWLFAPGLVATKMACEPRLMEQEGAIAGALSGHQTIKNGAEGAMVLGDERNTITLIFSGACPDCDGLDDDTPALPPEGEWDLQFINNTRVSDDGQPYRITLSDGKIMGYAGCNRFFGDYTNDASTLHFGGIGATRMACHGQGGEDERAVFEMLRKPARYHVTRHGAMVLANENGVLLLSRANR